MSERLRRMLPVETPIGRVEYRVPDGFMHGTITVSVVLATSRQNRQWNHALAYFGLTAVECQAPDGELYHYRVSGPFHGLNRLITLRNVKCVEYADRKIYGGRSTMGSAKTSKPSKPSKGPAGALTQASWQEFRRDCQRPLGSENAQLS
jgi:hypothetical protein